MRFHQCGQAMAEYLVVASALVGAFYWGANTDCPGYDTCIEKVQKTIYNKYQGFSNSISSVQQYGELSGGGFNSSWGGGDGTTTVPGSGPGGGTIPSIPQASGLRQELNVSSAGGGGRLLSDGSVVNDNGDTVGTYDSKTETYKPTNGTPSTAQVTRVILNEDGDPAEQKVITACNGDVLGFAYASANPGKYFATVTLAPLDIGSNCASAYDQPVDANGDDIDGGVIDGYFYPSILSVGLSSTPLPHEGEVVQFPLPSPDSCAIVKSGWDAGIDDQVLADRAQLHQEAWDELKLTDPLAPEPIIDPVLEAEAVNEAQNQARLNKYTTDAGIRIGYVSSSSCPSVSTVDPV